MKNKVTAGLLAIFLGGWGAHKFYLKDPGTGVFYILLTVFGFRFGFPISYILAWIDAFVLFTMSDEKFDAKYNQNVNIRNRRRETRQRSGRQDYRANRRSYEANTRENPTYQNSRTRNEPARRRPVVRDNPFKTSGLKRLEDFELDLAEDELNKAIEITPNDAEIHFALAKVYSLTEEKDKSYNHISKAVQLGFKDFDKIRTDDELAYIRIQKEFDDFEENKFRFPPNSPIPPSQDKIPENEEIEAASVPENDLLQDDLLLSQLNKLAELRKKGLLSEREFEEERVKLLRR